MWATLTQGTRWRPHHQGAESERPSIRYRSGMSGAVRAKSTVLRGQPRIFRHIKAGASPDASALPDRNKPKGRLRNKRSRRTTTEASP
ncbi:Hypothetical protein Tpal_1197 [Trichococcus palustris]|jgi:hypothetical protein|uniref:Uncharacterized protein n=1 Tax=Trichococcus palustris TaxID=140314 RepID=A0A143YG49_9LACT|nr:Hypothetical protein Tpal_1197 [Trichococcus palustris]SFK98823.1 hypothetical protein SAMN04488076_11240 [Trichococcus palustris]